MSVTDGRKWYVTSQRAAVLKSLRACDRLVSAQTLHAALAADGTTVGLTTVYRTLRLLESAGYVDVVRDGEGERLYRPRAGDAHRHYLLCKECGLSLAVDAEEVERWVERAAQDLGFRSVDHTVELNGVCGPCHTGSDRTADS